MEPYAVIPYVGQNGVCDGNFWDNIDIRMIQVNLVHYHHLVVKTKTKNISRNKPSDVKQLDTQVISMLC